MKPIVWNAILAGALVLLPGSALAQAVRGNQSGGGHASHGNAARGGQMGGYRGGVAPSGKTSAAPGSSGGFGSRLGRSVADPSFAGRLGRTVGGYSARGGPAYGNINHPAGQTGIQPSPANTGAPIPNINYPGGSPGLYGDLPGSGGRHHRRGYSGYGVVYGGPIYYGVPYYVPVPVYTEVVTEAPPAPEPPRPFDIREYVGPVPAPVQPQQAAPERPARQVTLLAFKDSTVLAVTDYWLEGYSLVYETSLGVRTRVPIDRLDFYLTQQLNKERNVPFVLEARP